MACEQSRPSLGARCVVPFAFALLAVVLLPRAAAAVTVTRAEAQRQAWSGQDFHFSLTDLPEAHTDIEVRVDLYGGYNDPALKYAEVVIESTSMTPDVTGISYCSTTPLSRTHTFPAVAASDGAIPVLVYLSDTVDLPCPSLEERVVVTLTYENLTPAELRMNAPGRSPRRP